VGAYPVSFSANGQCFNESSAATFTTYNSQVNSINVAGAPSMSSVPLEVAGEGFVHPALNGGLCRFTLEGSVPQVQVDSPLDVVSTTLVRCLTPATGMRSSTRLNALTLNPHRQPPPSTLTLNPHPQLPASASPCPSLATASPRPSLAPASPSSLVRHPRPVVDQGAALTLTLTLTLTPNPNPNPGTLGQWSTKVLQNGLEADPALFFDPLFTTYDIAAVRVSSLRPPGGALPNRIQTEPSTTVVHSCIACARYPREPRRTSAQA
jgi:hypothetical protein